MGVSGGAVVDHPRNGDELSKSGHRGESFQQDSALNNRRRFLIASTSALGAVGVAGAAVPFISSWQPDAGSRAAGAPTYFDVGRLAPEQVTIVEWRGKPIYVLRRSAAQLATLEQLEERLADPQSTRPHQPDYIQESGAARALRSEFLVLVALCTHLGCAVKYRPEHAPEDLGPDWVGGFFCPCHGSRFDVSGRVFSGVPAAPNNLVVPPHRYESDGSLVIGVSAGEALS